MNADRQTTGMDIKVKLSTLWIFVLFNMIYAEIGRASCRERV